MVIAHNMLAMNAGRQLGINAKGKAKSTEKLSSGYKINRAADDAAGLAISEKMRRQIRGLNQGASNIQDGISLVQTADGALGEVADILQRVRELSIKSYNETNSESDIAKIQEEVDNILLEIDRIGETTTFNETRIFKDRDDLKVSISASHTEEVVTGPVYRTVPEWLTDKSDSKMEVHSEYKMAQERGATEIMFQDADINNDGQKEKVYYGPDQDLGTLNGYEWAGNYGVTGEWSGTIEDNPSCRLDFSGVYEVMDAQGLYDNLEQLIGSEIAFPCGTCTEAMPGIFFTGEIEGVEVLSAPSEEHYSQLDLSAVSFTYGQDADGNAKVYQGYFEAIEAMMNEHETSAKTEAEKQLEIQDLGKAIAMDLRDKSFDLLDERIKDLDHFDRIIKGDDDTSFIVYDFRDKGLSSSNAAETSLETTGSLVSYRENVRVNEVVETFQAENNIYVFTGVDAKTENKIPITLPVISLKQMNLNGYRVGNQYYEESYWEYEGQIISGDNAEYEKQKADYQKALEKYEKDMAEYEKAMDKYEKAMEEYQDKCDKINDDYQAEYDAWKAAYATENKEQVPFQVPEYGEYYEDGEKKEGIIGSKTEYWEVTVVVANPGAPSPPTKAPLPTKPVQPTQPQKPVEPTPPILSRAASADSSGWVLKSRKVRREDVLDPVDEAIAYISKYRAILGAQQNRLEHAYNNNRNTSENTQAAESQIRDTDMAREMIGNTQSSILSQSIQSMLAQANQSNQGVLGMLG